MARRCTAGRPLTFACIRSCPWNGRSGALALPGRQTGAAVQAVARLGQVAFGQAFGAGAGDTCPARRCEVISAVTMLVGTASVPQPSSIMIGG